MSDKNIRNLKEELFRLLEKDALKRGEFILSSGKTSNYYLDGRVITLTAQGAYLVAAIILEMIEGCRIDAVGGPTLGADPIAGAVAALSHIKKTPLKAFIVRKAAKEHGAKRRSEGPELKKGERVVLIDDVVTTGKALIEAKEELDRIGVIIDRAIVIVDRQEGAQDNLAKAGIRLEPIFQIKDFGI
jgi:orotate phosphoribosyltransferase